MIRRNRIIQVYPQTNRKFQILKNKDKQETDIQQRNWKHQTTTIISIKVGLQKLFFFKNKTVTDAYVNSWCLLPHKTLPSTDYKFQPYWHTAQPYQKSLRHLLPQPSVRLYHGHCCFPQALAKTPQLTLLKQTSTGMRTFTCQVISQIICSRSNIGEDISLCANSMIHSVIMQHSS